MINKRTPYRMVRPTVHVPAVRAFTVSRFGQLERGIRTYVLDVVCRFGLISIRINGQRLRSSSRSHREVLLISILLVLYLSHRRRFTHRPILALPLTPNLCKIYQSNIRNPAKPRTHFSSRRESQSEPLTLKLIRLWELGRGRWYKKDDPRNATQGARVLERLCIKSVRVCIPILEGTHHPSVSKL